MAFDPDKYLAENESGQFDPDAYLAEHEPRETAKPISVPARIAIGAFHPSVAAAQLIGKGLESAGIGYGKDIQDYYAGKEKTLQERKAASGSDGFDFADLAGNLLSPESIATMGIAPAATLLGKGLQGAAIGAGTGALTPSQGDVDLEQRGKQAVAGMIAGGALAPITSAASRIVSPAASLNPELQKIKEAGISPTIGQALGGAANYVEQKLTSVPLFGDLIASAREKSIQQFNNAAINRATEPVGVKIEGHGTEAIKQAGNALSKAYKDALDSIDGVKFDNDFIKNIQELKAGAESLVPEMNKKFNKTLSNIVGSRMSPAGGMLPDVYKKVDSELGQIASRYGKSQNASESEFGDSIRQLQSLLREQVARSNPQVSDKIRAADTGWAHLVRLEKAANSASNKDGVFSPAQLNSAIKSSDNSARKRAVARGDALMQDFGNAGQKVLATTVPNSGTVDRTLTLALGGAAALHPAIAATVVAAGSAGYSPAAQRALVKLVSERPELAPLLAERIQQASNPATQAVVSRISSGQSK